MADNGNEPAFPFFVPDQDGTLAPGLTKREAAAISIAAGIEASLPMDNPMTPEDVSVRAVSVADALLAELEKREAGG